MRSQRPAARGLDDRVDERGCSAISRRCGWARPPVPPGREGSSRSLRSPLAFAVLLYLGPDVEQPRWQLITPGAIAALVIWLAASGGFAVYTANFGSYNKTWGTLSAVVVTLIWLWLTKAVLLFGAEINAEAQRLAAARRDRDLAAAVARKQRGNRLQG